MNSLIDDAEDAAIKLPHELRGSLGGCVRFNYIKTLGCGCKKCQTSQTLPIMYYL